MTDEEGKIFGLFFELRSVLCAMSRAHSTLMILKANILFSERCPECNFSSLYQYIFKKKKSWWDEHVNMKMFSWYKTEFSLNFPVTFIYLPSSPFECFLVLRNDHKFLVTLFKGKREDLQATYYNIYIIIGCVLVV